MGKRHAQFADRLALLGIDFFNFRTNRPLESGSGMGVACLRYACTMEGNFSFAVPLNSARQSSRGEEGAIEVTISCELGRGISASGLSDS